jgi:hypothetical protein
MKEAEIRELGIDQYNGIEEMGAAAEVLRACPSLPKDLYKTVVRNWATNAYIIYSNKEKRGICTRCGHVLGACHFPIYSYISAANHILMQRIKAGLTPDDIFELDIEEGGTGQDPDALTAWDITADRGYSGADFAALKEAAHDGRLARRITSHGTKYICPHCGAEATLLESGRGRGKFTEELIVTVPLVRSGSIYILNLWTDIIYTPFGLPYVAHYLKSIYIFSQKGDRYFARGVPHTFFGSRTFAEHIVTLRNIHIPYPPSPMGYNYPRRTHCTLYSTKLGSIFKHTQWKYARWYDLFAFAETGKHNPNWNFGEVLIKYLYCYKKDPAVERLEQSGFVHLVFHYIMGETQRGALNYKQNKLTKIFKMPMDDIRKIRAAHILDPVIGIYRKLKEIDPEVTPQQAEAISHFQDWFSNDIKYQALGISRISFLRYQRKENAKDSTRADNWLSPDDYSDYINECHILNYDLNAKSVLFPKDFPSAHERTSALVDNLKHKKEAEVRKKVAPLIRSWGESIARRREPFIYNSLLIRPAKDAEEILREGRLQHHCVGTYWEGQAKGEYAIMFIRKVEDPDKPYYTLQLSSAGKVMQNRGKSNCSVTPAVAEFVAVWKREVIDKSARKAPKKTVKKSAVSGTLAAAAI